MFGLARKSELISAVYSGGEAELTEEAWYFFRGVLPPVWENETHTWDDGQTECCNFAFADGQGPAIAFYVRWDGPQRRHFARNTGQML
jgi:hypothetical protein